MTGSGIRPGVARLLRLASRRRGRVADEVDEEIRHHLEERERQLVARGLDPVAARAEALRRFGDVTTARERLHASAERREDRMRLREAVADLVHDARFAWRGLRRAPAFLAVAVACLALGIGANAAMFSVIDAVLLRPLPFERADRLVRVWSEGVVPLGVLDIVRGQTTSYTDLGGYEAGSRVSLSGAGEAARVLATRTTPNLFGVLGVQPATGRAFVAADADPGGARVAIVSDALWRDRLGGRSDAVGRTIAIDGVPHTIVGIMPRSFRFPSDEVAIWTPVREARGTAGYWWATWFQMVGRLKEGASEARAQSELAVVLDRARGAFPMRMPDEWGRGATVSPLQDAVVGGSRASLLLMLGAVAVVLLVACVNVATLSLGRASARARELAVRAALGAGRGRIARLLLAECAIVGTLGTLVGLAVAGASLRVLVAMLPAGIPRVSEIALDARVLGFAVLLMLVSTLVFGLLPSLRATRVDLSSTLRAPEGVAGRLLRLRAPSLLVMAQLALAVVLVAGAGLLLRNLWELRQTALGFRTDGVLTAEIPLPSFPGDTAARAPLYYETLLERVGALPGVRAAAVASAAPFGDGVQSAAMAVEAHPTPDGGVPPTPAVVSVSGDFFRTLGVPLLRGRAFDATDTERSPRVALVDAVGARRLWPGEDPVGQRIRYVWMKEWITVVGVVGSVKRDSLTSADEPALYVPMRQGFPRGMRLLAHVARADAAMAGALRESVRSVDADVPVATPRPLGDLVAGSAAGARFATMLLALFAGVSLLLGAVGIYGVMSATVTGRMKEFGVRLAIGASSRQLLALVLRQSLALAAAGTAIGFVATLAGNRILARFLHGVTAWDPLVLAAVPCVLVATTLLAAYVPARRAARADPMLAIRNE